ncbi:TonB-dependent receptor [bacterium]|nr:TonB-dependent receptor [bacterium]
MVLLLTGGSLLAQQAGLRGIVLDAESGASIENAYLFIYPQSDPGAAREQTTQEEGSFFFEKLKPGPYSLRINRAGYHEQSMNVDVPAHEERDMIIYLRERNYRTEPVVVTGTHMHSRVEDPSEVATVLRGKDLDRELGLTLAATLKNETGIAMRAMGPAPARPVIRGLGGDRVLITEDGNKTTDLSATSPDHAVTIEPFAAERIEVLRGPRVLTQSPVTLGGVVNVIRHDIAMDRHEHVLGSVGVYGESANRGYLASAHASVPLASFILRGDVSRREAGDLDTPEGRLHNSSAASTDMGFGGSYIDGGSYGGASYRGYDLAYGVPGGFVGAHPNGVDIELERRQINARASYAVDGSFLHDVSVQASRAYYRHKEFEASGLIGSEFRIVNYPGRIWMTHHSVGPIDEGNIGLNYEYRDFSVGGFVFTSPSTSMNLAPYLFERWTMGPVEMEAAVRYNYDRITPLHDDPNARIGHIREREFHTWSASATALIDVTDIVHVGMNVSRSSRVPTIEELFSEGPHLAAYSYEVGNPNLPEEHGIGTELFLYHRWDALYFNINLFRNALQSFITPRNTGEINYATFLPVYATSSVEALLYGAEAQIGWHILPELQVDASVSYTHGSFAETGDPLPQIPPVKGRVGVTWKRETLQLGMHSTFAGRQSRVDAFEEETAGYAILGGFAQYSFSTGAQVHNLSLSAENVLDQVYRNHLSRVKAVLPEAGVNLRLTYKLHFELH